MTPTIHRRNKGMGGTSRADRDALHNLLALDPDVHNGHPWSVHMRRGWSTERGYLVPKDAANPAVWPVLIRGVRWVLLTADGRYRPLPSWIRPTLGDRTRNPAPPEAPGSGG